MNLNWLLENDLDIAGQHVLGLIVLELDSTTPGNDPDADDRLARKVQTLIALVGADTWGALQALRSGLGNGPFYDALYRAIRGEYTLPIELPPDLGADPVT